MKTRRCKEQTVHLGIIGCGVLGMQHAEALHRNPKARLVAFCNRSSGKAERACAKFGGEYHATDARRLFEDERLDAVVIATHHDSHAPLCIAAARHGKHMLVEKPLALTVDECTQIVRAVENAGVKCMVAFKLRYSPTVQRAQQLLPQPQLLVGRMVDDRWPDNHWAQDPHTGGGNIRSQGCHIVDLLCYLAGAPPVRVYAEAASLTHPRHACPDQMVATIRFENGSLASWIQGDSGTAARGSKFSLELHGEGQNAIEIYDRLKSATIRSGDRVEELHGDAEEGLQLQDDEFVDCLLRDVEPSCGPRDGWRAAVVTEACLAACRSGRSQTIPDLGTTPRSRRAGRTSVLARVFGGR